MIRDRMDRTRAKRPRKKQRMNNAKNERREEEEHERWRKEMIRKPRQRKARMRKKKETLIKEKYKHKKGKNMDKSKTKYIYSAFIGWAIRLINNSDTLPKGRRARAHKSVTVHDFRQVYSSFQRPSLRSIPVSNSRTLIHFPQDDYRTSAGACLLGCCAL